MSFVEPIAFHCPSCGKSRDNPNATLQDERGNFRSLVNCSQPKHCNDCKPLLRDHPFPDPAPTHTELRNRHQAIDDLPLHSDNIHYRPYEDDPRELRNRHDRLRQRADTEPVAKPDTEVVDDPDARRR